VRKAIGIIFLLFCVNSKKPVFAQQIPVLDYASLKKDYLNRQSDTLYVINFWATWCKPCIKELPYFDSLVAHFPSEKIKVVLVSLDFQEKLEKGLKPFLANKNIKSEVVLFDDQQTDFWINDIHQNWSGAIPATLIYKNAERWFYEKEFNFDELIELIDSKINNK
jgi:thiol-disulfide isomerase/thioredoxin